MKRVKLAKAQLAKLRKWERENLKYYEAELAKLPKHVREKMLHGGWHEVPFGELPMKPPKKKRRKKK